MLWVIAAVTLPLIVLFGLIAADVRRDLSELQPKPSEVASHTRVVAWEELESANPPLSDSSQPVRMLGYMIGGYTPQQNGSITSMFILVPEAGHILHPAHRHSDQMVEVWPTRPVQLHYRHLVWVSGKLTRRNRAVAREVASYSMTNAEVEPAPESEIDRWFQVP